MGMNGDANVTPGGTFNLETCCDNLVIGGVDVEPANAVPASLSAGDTFTWNSDGSVTREGWQLCFSNPIGSSASPTTLSPTHTPTQTETTQPETTGTAGFFTMTGDCDIQGDCVSSSNYPGRHGNRESCSVTMNGDANVTPGGTFNLETCCDNLVIGGVDVESANAVPASLSAGDTFTWNSDGSVTREGWQLCFSNPIGCSTLSPTAEPSATSSPFDPTADPTTPPVGSTAGFFTMTGDCDIQG